MKQFMITLVVMLAISVATVGQTSPKQVDTITTTVVKDTLSNEDYNNIDSEDLDELKHLDNKLEGLSQIKQMGGVIVPVVAIIGVFGMPVFIILITMFFQNKSKQARYRLAEKALENGKDIPEGLFEKKEENLSTQAKGIKNIFLGLGLGIFLWALTSEFGLGCVGFMVMFTGIGQVIIHYTQNQSSQRRPGNSDFAEKDNTPKESDDK